MAIYLCPSILLNEDFRYRIRWQNSQSEDNLCNVRQNITSASFAWHSSQKHANLLSIFCKTGQITLSTLRWNRHYGSFSSLSLLMARIEQEEEARWVSISRSISAMCWGIVEYYFCTFSFVLFDTGSSILSLFDHGLIAMGFYQVAYPDVGSVHITTVDGSTSEFSGYTIEWQLSEPGLTLVGRLGWQNLPSLGKLLLVVVACLMRWFDISFILVLSQLRRRFRLLRPREEWFHN